MSVDAPERDATADTPAEPRRRTWSAVLVGGILVASVVFRFWTHSDLWLDEALSVNIARLPFRDLHAALRHDGAPPLYYVLLHYWISAFGIGNLAVRSLSGVLSVLTLPLAWFAGRRLGGRLVAWLSVLVLATSPYAFRFATESRMYSLIMLFVFAGYLATLRALERPSLGRLALVAVITAVLVYTQYWCFYLVAVAGALLVYRIWRSGPGPARRDATRVLAAVALGVVTFAPWVPTFLYQARHTGTPWGDPQLPWSAIPLAVVRFAGSELNAEAFILTFGLVTLVVLGIFGRALDRRTIALDVRPQPGRRREAILAVGTLVLGTSVSYLAGSAFDARYASVMYPFVVLLIAVGISLFLDPRVRAGVLAFVVLLGVVGGVRNVTTNRTQAAQSTNIIAAEARPGDLVVYCPDQIGPSASRLLRSVPGLVQVTFPDLASPDRVNWVDYRSRIDATNLSTFAQQVAGPIRRAHHLVRVGRWLQPPLRQVRSHRHRARPVPAPRDEPRAGGQQHLRVHGPHRLPPVTRLRRLGDTTFVRRDLTAAAGPWVTARLIVVAALVVTRYGENQVGARPEPVQLHQGLFAWDAAFYRSIATNGYTSLPKNALRFFPLVPLLTRALGTLLLSHEGVALIVVVNLSALVFGALLHRLAFLETGDAALARRAAWFGAIFPPFAALVLGYADATAMALAAGMLLALRTRRFALAIPLGVLVGVCRPVGVLLVAPALIEAARGWRAAPTRDRAVRAGAVAAPAVGLGAFLAYAGVAVGDAFAPLTVQNQAKLRGRVEFPVTSLLNGIRDLAHAGRFGPGLHVLWAVVFAALLVVIARRLPASYTAYAAVALVLACSAQNLDSFERYCATTLPFLLAVAIVTKRPEAERAALVLAAAAMFGYTVLIFLGLYVP